MYASSIKGKILSLMNSFPWGDEYNRQPPTETSWIRLEVEEQAVAAFTDSSCRGSGGHWNDTRRDAKDARWGQPVRPSC